MGDAKAAEALFEETFARSATRMNRILSFRRVAEVGLTHSHRRMAEEDTRFLRELATSSRWTGLLKDPM